MTFKYSDASVLVFAKAPVAGQVNTRLIPDIGTEAATELQYELIHSRLASLNNSSLCDVQLWCAPGCNHEFFQYCKSAYNVAVFDQKGTDLGERMSLAIKKNLKSFNRVVLIGTDAPSLTIEHIDESINQLSNNDVVIAPAEDGGYVLIGMSRYCNDVFQSVSWGSDAVLESTRKKIAKNNLTSFELETFWDIDRIDDYIRYKKNVV